MLCLATNIENLYQDMNIDVVNLNYSNLKFIALNNYDDVIKF
jgi:hypothetical protein